MAKHFATFTGIIDIQDDAIEPPGTGPGVPTHPITLPGDPGWGQIPGFGGPGGGLPIGPGSPGYPVRPHPEPPLGWWGAGSGFPTHPIQLPPWAGKPQPPFPGTQPPWQPPGPTSPPPVVSQPIAGVPGPGGQLVFFYSPVYGVVAVPASGSWADFLPQPVAPPVPTEPPPTTGAPEPPVA